LHERSDHRCILRFFLERQGVAIPADLVSRHHAAGGASAAIQDALLNFYRTRPDLAILFELMTDFDEGQQEWRYRHVKVVERTIGAKARDGGSPGVSFQAVAVSTRFLRICGDPAQRFDRNNPAARVVFSWGDLGNRAKPNFQICCRVSQSVRHPRTTRTEATFPARTDCWATSMVPNGSDRRLCSRRRHADAESFRSADDLCAPDWRNVTASSVHPDRRTFPQICAD